MLTSYISVPQQNGAIPDKQIEVSITSAIGLQITVGHLQFTLGGVGSDRYGDASRREWKFNNVPPKNFPYDPSLFASTAVLHGAEIHLDKSIGDTWILTLLDATHQLLSVQTFKKDSAGKGFLEWVPTLPRVMELTSSGADSMQPVQKFDESNMAA